MSTTGRVLRGMRRQGRPREEVQASKPSEPPQVFLPPPEERGGTLTAAQIRWFETFGFLRLPGLFADDIEQIDREFEAVFDENPIYETHEEIHFNGQRKIMLDLARKSPLLQHLPSDPRATGVVRSLLGEEFEEIESDGSIFSCDTSWHSDTYGAPLHLRHVKLSLYLEPLDGDSGAIRLLVGTNHFQDSFARTVRSHVQDPLQIEEVLGVAPEELPAHVLQSDPGDVVIWDYRTVHASFGGGARRRLLSLNYRGTADGFS